MSPSPKKERGRPEFVPTDEHREKVQVLRAQGMSQEAIASVIGISVPTLVRAFSLDLEIAVASKTADVMMARYRSAMGGSVPAQNKFLELAGALPDRTRKAKPKQDDRGKKEVANEAAQTAEVGTGWGELLN